LKKTTKRGAGKVPPLFLRPAGPVRPRTRASVDVVFAIGYNAKVCVRAAARVTPFYPQKDKQADERP
jgi:hypothetical protein